MVQCQATVRYLHVRHSVLILRGFLEPKLNNDRRFFGDECFEFKFYCVRCVLFPCFICLLSRRALIRRFSHLFFGKH